MTSQIPQGTTRNCKGPHGTALDCKGLHLQYFKYCSYHKEAGKPTTPASRQAA